jgi:hypothetical protein
MRHGLGRVCTTGCQRLVTLGRMGQVSWLAGFAALPLRLFQPSQRLSSSGQIGKDFPLTVAGPRRDDTPGCAPAPLFQRGRRGPAPVSLFSCQCGAYGAKEELPFTILILEL